LLLTVAVLGALFGVALLIPEDTAGLLAVPLIERLLGVLVALLLLIVVFTLVVAKEAAINEACANVVDEDEKIPPDTG